MKAISPLTLEFWPRDKSLSNGYSQIWMDFILVSAKLVGSMEHNGNIREKFKLKYRTKGQYVLKSSHVIEESTENCAVVK